MGEYGFALTKITIRDFSPFMEYIENVKYQNELKLTWNKNYSLCSHLSDKKTKLIIYYKLRDIDEVYK